MIKMKSHHPLLVGGEARTEFETDELHARELELAGLAVREPVAEALQVAADQSHQDATVPADAAIEEAQKATASVTPVPEPVPAPAATAIKAKKAK